LEIIVREKCGLPHHINYFCSPTYFFIFSCFSKAREAVKRTFEMKFSYIELT